MIQTPQLTNFPTTYSISQYQKKPKNNTRTIATTSSNTYHYDTFFNQNFKNSIALTDYEEEEKQKRLEESYNSLIRQNEKLSKELEMMKDQMGKLVEDNAFLENKVGKLSEQNEEMSRFINEQKNQLMLNDEESNSLLKRNDELSKELDKTKNSLRKSLMENDDLRNENSIVKNEANKLKSDKDLLNQKNMALADLNRKNQELLNKFQQEHEDLQNESLQNNMNKNALIDDLKNQIDALKNNLDKVDKDKRYFEDKFYTQKNDDDKKIGELNNKIKFLTNENEKLGKIAGDNKKLNKQLIREKETLIERLNKLENDLQNALSKNKSSKDPSANPMLIDCLKGENYDLKELNAKYKKMLDLLFAFVNELNQLFNLEEISIEQCKENINDLVDDLNTLKENIFSLLHSNENDEKWNELQNKLLNKKLVINEPKLSKDDEENEVENDWKSGKCAACDLGRNVSLKGCSPYFCNKHTFKYSTKK